MALNDRHPVTNFFPSSMCDIKTTHFVVLCIYFEDNMIEIILLLMVALEFSLN